jgi:hypothetical protein
VNIGLTANFRRVFEVSSGDYFMWTSADDVRPPTVVEIYLKALMQNHRAMMVYGPVLMKLLGRGDLVEVTNAMDLSNPAAPHRIKTYTQKLVSQCIIYGLFKREAVVSAIFPNSYGQEYLFCLQVLLLGPFVYLETPMLVYQLKRTALSRNPMYPEVPITVMSLLKASGIVRRKCWTILIRGSYYLLRIRRASLPQRVFAMIAHVVTFCCFYRRRLAKEIVFELFTPVAWLGLLSWRFARQWAFSFRVACKVRSVLTGKGNI